jgi:membrane fusion protein (multidrug efflux system)
MFALVPDNVWITANFKESQIGLMRPGQPVEIDVDALPGHKFDGRVDSIQAGSGAAFSLLPPENATGNYVKVVQRVPVKLVSTSCLTPLPLGPGESVVPTVKCPTFTIPADTCAGWLSSQGPRCLHSPQLANFATRAESLW